MSFLPSRLDLYCNGYQPISDNVTTKPPKTGSNAVKPNYVPPASVKSDDVVLSFREYNDLLTRIYFLEEKVKFLSMCNTKLGEQPEENNSKCKIKLRKCCSNKTCKNCK